MINSAIITGIVPSDILVKTAIEAAINDLRQNPWLLDYVFSWYPNDTLTSQSPNYGESQRQKAKDWFLKNEIFISYNYRSDVPKFPMISVGFQSSSEAESTLGDINYDPSDELDESNVGISPKPIIGPFSVLNYDKATGQVTLPDTVTTDNIFTGMVLVDPETNTGYPISDIIDSQNFIIDANITANFSNAYISPIDNFYVATVESCWFKNNFKISCLCQNDAVEALYLEQVVLFILLRYKEQLLEGRGFERSTVNSGPLYLYQENDIEFIWGKDITLSGYVRHVWPKTISPKIQGISINSVKIIGGSATPPGLLDQVQLQGWKMENDLD